MVVAKFNSTGSGFDFLFCLVSPFTISAYFRPSQCPDWQSKQSLAILFAVIPRAPTFDGSYLNERAQMRYSILGDLDPSHRVPLLQRGIEFHYRLIFSALFLFSAFIFHFAWANVRINGH
jgi:hypothetical protein